MDETAAFTTTEACYSLFINYSGYGDDSFAERFLWIPPCRRKKGNYLCLNSLFDI